MGGAFLSCAPEPHSSPRRALRPSASQAPPSAQRPPWPRPSSHLSSHCLSHPLFHVSSAHPPISSPLPRTPSSSASTPAAVAVPSHSSSLFHPHPSPPFPAAPSPRPPFPLLPSALHPYPIAPQPHLPSVIALAPGKICSRVWGIVLRTFSPSRVGLVWSGGEGNPVLGESVWCGVFRPLAPQPEAACTVGVQPWRCCFLPAPTVNGPVRRPLMWPRVGLRPMLVHGCTGAWEHAGRETLASPGCLCFGAPGPGGLPSPPQTPLGKCGQILLRGESSGAGGGLGLSLVSRAGSFGPLPHSYPRTLYWHNL